VSEAVHIKKFPSSGPENDMAVAVFDDLVNPTLYFWKEHRKESTVNFTPLEQLENFQFHQSREHAESISDVFWDDGWLFDRVSDEALRAIEKHGFDRTPANPDMSIHEKMTILVEEVGEVARACTYDEGSSEQRIEELVQVATMALMWAAAELETQE